MKLKEKNLKSSEQEGHFLESLEENQICFWVDSSGGPTELCKNSFYSINPEYYFYGYLDEINLVESIYDPQSTIRNIKVNCFDFLEEKIKGGKDNPDGVFVGYFAYDLFQRKNIKEALYPDFFFAYFDKIRPLTSKMRGEIPFSLQVSGLISRVGLKSNMTDAEYLEKVKLIKEEIKAGNVYQVNLTREYSIKIDPIHELDLYLRLRSVSPNPYGCFFKTPFVTILSSSPEEFLYVGQQVSRSTGQKEDLQAYRPVDLSTCRPSYIRTRPIKGTLLKDEFNIDPKNKAENIMIVDLERNDLGRICEYGSIKAKKLLDIESYKHLNHVVSTVEGKLRKEVRLKEIFQSLFPGGSITGAPKISAMKLINKIEPRNRGAYTGSFGYIKTDGTMNFNILIRTIFIHDNKITFNVGGGVVADSEPEGELEEIKLKAKGIIEALKIDYKAKFTFM